MQPLLKVETQELELLITCNSYDGIVENAARHLRAGQNEHVLLSTYNWQSEESKVWVLGKEIQPDKPERTVFYENADYQIWTSFKVQVASAWIDTPLKRVQQGFDFHEVPPVLFGHINYGNDIGRAELKIAYQLKDGRIKRFSLGYDVLATKIDYHTDLRLILDDIEQQYRMLSLDFYRMTFHAYKESAHGDTPDIIWWNVFQEVHDDFIRHVKSVVDRPHHRLINHEVYVKAEKIRKLTPTIESELNEYRKDARHLYRTRVPDMDVDTYENRFLKFAVQSISDKFSELLECFSKNYKKAADDKFMKTLHEADEELKRLSFHPFFRRIGRFHGFTQESLVLKQGAGYAGAYSSWILLTCSYDLEDGMRTLQLKDIATLYEIWCFIEVRRLVEKLLGKGIKVRDLSRTELNRGFALDLKKGKNSRVVFSRKDRHGQWIELAEVMYNPKEAIATTSKETTIPHTHSYTVPQKPDIVLQLNRRDIGTGFRLTYLFDAKYRIGDEINAVDCPPDDAINQMHRYRDALYYDPEQEGLPLKKEVIGGYILFPGHGKDDKVEQAEFYRSIEKVNIGAFPLRPNREESSMLLEKFLHSLIWEQPTVQILQETKSHKGTSLSVEKTGNVLAVTVFETGNREYYKLFNERAKEVEYYFGQITPSNKLGALNFQKYDYFVPVMNGMVRDVYQITFSSIRRRKDIPQASNKPIDPADVRIVLKLSNPSYLSGKHQFIKMQSGLFPPRRWAFREFTSVSELMNFAIL